MRRRLGILVEEALARGWDASREASEAISDGALFRGVDAATRCGWWTVAALALGITSAIVGPGKDDGHGR